MKKKKKRVSPSAIFVTSILIFIIPVVYYALVWVPERKAQLIDRYMRIVAMMSDQLETKGENITKVIKQAKIKIKNKKESPGKPETKIEDINIEMGVKNWIEALLKLSIPSVEVRLISQELKMAKKLEQEPNTDAGTSDANTTPVSTNTQETRDKPPGDQSKEGFKVIKFDYIPNQEKVKFELYKEIELIDEDGSVSGKGPITFAVSLDVTDYIKEICREEEFDDVFIIDENCNLIYRESKPVEVGTKSGIRFMKLKGLFKKAGSDQKKAKAKKSSETNGDRGNECHSQYDAILSDVKDISIAKKNYKVFLQPIPLKFIKSNYEDNVNKEQHWFVCGLLSATQLDKRSRKISNHILLFFLLGLALAFIAYPLVKLWLMGTNNRFRMRDIIFLFLMLVVGIPVITYSIITVISYYAQENNYEKNLITLSNHIHRNFVYEIRTAYEQLDILSNKKNKVIYLFRDPQKKKKRGNNNDERPQLEIIEKSPFLLKALDRNNALVYPYFDMAFVMNKDGDQEYKRHTTSKPKDGGKEIVNIQETVNQDGITFHNVSQRAYFKNIKEGKYWYIKNKQPMILEPLYSKSTGIFELNLAIPIEGDEHYLAAGMSFRPLSIINPVVPPDHGFAIIDGKGKVIFHSDSRVNFYENFFSECGDATALQSAIFAGISHPIKKTLYKGKRHDLYVRPIQGTPWTLVTFRNLNVHGSRNMEKIYRALPEYFKYIAVLALILLAYVGIWYIQKKLGGIRTERLYMKFRWIWPDKRLQWKYTVATLLNLLTLAVLLFQHFFLETFSLDSLFLPAIILIPIYLGLMGPLSRENLKKNVKDDKSKSRGQKLIQELRYRWDTIGMLFLMVLILLFSQLKFIQKGKISDLNFLLILLYLQLLFIPGEREKVFKIKGLKDRWFYRHSHSLMLYTLLLLMIAYPSLLYYKIAHKEEMLTHTRYQQLTLARDYLKWKNWREIAYKDQEDALKKFDISYDPDYHSGELGIYSIPEQKTVILDNAGYGILQNQEGNSLPLKKLQEMNKNIKLLPLELYEQLSLLPKNNNPTGNENNPNNQDNAQKSTGNNIPVNDQSNSPGVVKSIVKTMGKAYVTSRVSAHLMDYFDKSGVPPLDYTLLLKSINKIMPTDNRYSQKILYLYGSRPKDPQLNWEVLKTKKGSIISHLDYGEEARLHYDPIKNDPNHLHIISIIHGGRVGNIYSLVCFLLIALFLSVILYYVVRFIGRFIFLKELTVASGESTIIFNHQLKKEPGKFFIFGKAAKELQSKYKKQNSCIIDCASNDFDGKYTKDFSWLTNDIKFILVINLDYKMHVPEFNLKKLQFLEGLVFAHDVNITVFSQFEPVQYFDFSTSLPQKKNNGKKENNGKDQNDAPKTGNGAISARWQSLKRLFEQRYEVERISAEEKTDGLHEDVRDFILEECGDHIPYLKGVRNKVITDLNNTGQTCMDTPGLKDRIYEQAKPIYDRIWAASTRDEKLVLLQLAKYGLLNLKNRETIRRLLRRGLIDLSPLRMMNRTFTDYVLCVPDSEAIIQWKKNLGGSRWSSVRKPFFFFAISIMLFLVVTQPDLFKSWLLLIPAISTSIPALLRLFDTFSGDTERSD